MPALAAPATISLAGEWCVGLGTERKFTSRMHLPGSTDQAKLGTRNTEKPTLDGLYRLYTYEGPAWYQREVEIPAAWRGKRIQLFLERTHWETHVWMDDQDFGVQDSLIAPHVYELGPSLTPGRHRLTILVDNTRKINLGRFVSILYEGTQTNWNGIIGKLELRAFDPVSIADAQVFPDVERKIAKVRVTIANATGKLIRAKLVLRRAGGQSSREFTASERLTTVEAELPMGANVRLWDEFSPVLYDLTVSLAAGPYSDARTVTFGMRKFATRSTQFTMNGRPVFLRGTLECAIFPLTGYPPTDVESWRRIYRVVKSYGLNHMRFHSWCPPEAAFTAADLEGIMIQAEGPQANIKAGEDPKRDAFIEQEFLRIVRTYGNHPSFCLMTLGNEYGGPDAILSRWVDMLIKEDPRHLYSSASNAPKTANRQFTVTARPRGVKGPATDIDFRDDIGREDRPLAAHEIGQWTFFPNFDEMKKYTGVLAAKNFELVRDDLAAKHMSDLAPRFFDATGRQAVLLYKEEMELLLRTPGHAGFALLDLHDYPGQGTALIGPLDPFWDSKGFVSGEQHRRYCGPTVPLLRLKKRTFTSDETLAAPVEVAHFGPQDIVKAQPRWSIRDQQGREVASGSLPALDVPTGKLTPLGAISAPVAKIVAPAKLTVAVSLKTTRATFQNDWDIWVYPASESVMAPANVRVSREWDDATKQALADGASVVLLPKAFNAAQSLGGRFLPVFWSPVWFPTQRPNTMGILCDPKHPVFRHFPTESYSNWQWYDLIQNSRSLILDETPATFRPIVQVIDNFARNHKLGNLFEARAGKGRLVVCTLDLSGIAGSQLQKGIYEYAGSARFQPAGVLDMAFLDRLLIPSASSIMQNLGAKIVRVDSQQGGYEAVNLIDGDEATMWHTGWGDSAPPFPHEVVIQFAQPARISGLTCLPRQDRNRNGWIKDYEVQLSDDGRAWRTAAKGQFDRSAKVKTVTLTQPQTARYLKFIAISGFDNQPFAALAELAVIQ